MITTYVIYTHTDMKDVWNVFFGQFEKYIDLTQTKVYVAVNELSENIPQLHTQIKYDDSVPYTERWKHILNSISEETFIFLHEDMILYDNVDMSYLERYYEYVRNGNVNSIKLISAGSNFATSSFDETLVKNEYSILSIQPTIIKKSYFKKLLSFVESLNIWEFESFIYNNQLGNHDYMVKTGHEKKRGIFHYDSYVFPYIATAIVKGKWNVSEYPDELKSFFKIYGIDSGIRGCS